MFGKTKSSVSTLVNRSIDLYEQKKYGEAEKICRKVLQKDSRNYTLLINLGNILFIKKEFAEALENYKKADEIKPDYYPIKVNLANTYLEMGDFDSAEFYARQSLDLASKSALGWNILGNALLEKEQFSDSLPALLNALKLDSRDPWLYNSLSRVYQQIGEFEKALAAGWSAVLLTPENEDSQHINFGYLLYETAMEKSSEKAQKYADLWLKKYPHNKIAEHMGNAIKNNINIERANDEYLQNIFDVFAPDFENVLCSLNYQTPQHIADFFEVFYSKNSTKNLQILDAGCGTGLCGKYLKKYAGFFTLSGVDLSSKMLEIAKTKKVYNHLYCQEINSFLSAKKQEYDLIISADVFTYFGNLDSLFTNLFFSLKKSGRIIFSITANEQNNDDYILHISGRFQHHENYVKILLNKKGFLIEKQERLVLRKEGGQDVWGYIFSAIKM